jgi:hypothetical protein
MALRAIFRRLHPIPALLVRIRAHANYARFADSFFCIVFFTAAPSRRPLAHSFFDQRQPSNLSPAHSLPESSNSGSLPGRAGPVTK